MRPSCAGRGIGRVLRLLTLRTPAGQGRVSVIVAKRKSNFSLWITSGLPGL